MLLSVFISIVSIGIVFGSDRGWVPRPLPNLAKSQYYSDIEFNSTEEVIKETRIRVKQWMTNETVPGFVVGIKVKGKTVWSEGFGQIDIENNVTTDKDAVWRLASVSKTLTSALMGRLMDRGLINLNDSVHKYLSEDIFPKKTFNGQPVDITLRQLLSHTAGVHRTNPDGDFNNVFKALNVTQSIAQFKDEKLRFKPGTSYVYSNYGFQLVGAVIESALNNTFQSEINQMFRSLGMGSTFAESRAEIYPHRTRYYWLTDRKPQHIENVNLIDESAIYEGYWPSMGVVSTIEDMLTFGSVMISAFKGKNNTFLDQLTVEELWTPETDRLEGSLIGDAYCKGWQIHRIKQSEHYPYKTMMWHSGGITGVTTILYLFPEEDVVAVGFANKGFSNVEHIVLNLAKDFKFLLK